MSRERRRLAIAVLAVIAAVTPIVAHSIGASCWVYLPAHVPVLLAGLAFGPAAGFVTGAATAVADLVWGGRVHGLTFLPLGLEFISYGLVAGLLSRGAPSYGRCLWALLAAMLAGRLVHLATATVLGAQPAHVLRGLFMMPWPGMLLQIAALPLAAARIRAAVERAAVAPVHLAN